MQRLLCGMVCLINSYYKFILKVTEEDRLRGVLKNLHDIVMKDDAELRAEAALQGHAAMKNKRSFFTLQTGRDVDYAIQKALSSVELERENDGQQRKDLANKILKDGLKIQKVASEINTMEYNLCNISHELELDIQRIQITETIEEELQEITDILENCSKNKLPVYLDDQKILNLCRIYSSDHNCERVKFNLKKVSSCEVIARYVSKNNIMIDLQLTIPKISDLLVAEIYTIPVFNDKSSYELQLDGHQFLIYDEFSTMVTDDCVKIDSSVFCQSNRRFHRQINSCVGGLLSNDTLAKCHFEKMTDNAGCFTENIEGLGIVISHRDPIKITKRRTDDDSRRQSIRHPKKLPTGIQIIENSADYITQGTCDGFAFETGESIFLTFASFVTNT